MLCNLIKKFELKLKINVMWFQIEAKSKLFKYWRWQLLACYDNNWYTNSETGEDSLHNCNSGDYKLLSTLCGSCSCSCFCFGCCGYMRGQRALLLKSKVLQCKSICSLATHKLVEKIRTFKQQTLAKCCSKSQKIKSAKDKEKTMKNKEKRRIWEQKIVINKLTGDYFV